MGLGGPVWHASVQSAAPIQVASLLRQQAEAQLRGVGDSALGEWHERTRAAYHIRRRLTPVEQRAVGPVRDIRRTPEAAARAAQLGGALLALVPPAVLADEVGP